MGVSCENHRQESLPAQGSEGYPLPDPAEGIRTRNIRLVLADSAGGRRQQVVELGKAGMSQGIAGLFLEAHPDPDRAKCDGPCALPLDRLGEFLAQMKAMDELVKSLPALEIS